MGAVWGENIKLSIFGESHGFGLGVVIDGIPAGTKLDIEYINKQMQRRAPGKNIFSTSRKESDQVEIISGIINGVTTGSPICGLIKNTDRKSKDYNELKEKMRPSHSDFPAYIKYKGFNDIRGGGHFSGRLTSMLVFAGAIAKQLLKEKDIEVYGNIKSIKDFVGESIENISIEKLKLNEDKDFPIADESMEIQMKEIIENARQNQNSVGGVIDCMITGLPAGIGDPFFNSLESTLSHIVFSVPGVKGIEFGKGFELTKVFGDEANDEYYYDEDVVKTFSNNNGGILGGISNGMPVVFSVAIKPTPSISKEQRTINIAKKENTILKIEGRHDPCIVHRAVVVIEMVAALAILDQLYKR